jgi:hypothetical protein
MAASCQKKTPSGGTGGVFSCLLAQTVFHEGLALVTLELLVAGVLVAVFHPVLL